jgi:hypothetical protein
VPDRQLDDYIARKRSWRAGRDNQAAIRGACEGRHITLDVAGIAQVDRAHLHSERWGRGLHRAQLARPCRYSGISQERYSLYAGGDLFVFAGNRIDPVR